MIDTKELRRLAQAATPGPDGVSLNWLKPLQDFQKEANPAVINELLDRLEEAESDALEQARLNGMGASREAALMAKLEATEKTNREWLRANAPEGWIDNLRIENDALRAKIEAIEKQEPVASVWRCDNGHIHGSCERTLPMGTKLYALPGAKGE